MSSQIYPTQHKHEPHLGGKIPRTPVRKMGTAPRDVEKQHRSTAPPKTPKFYILRTSAPKHPLGRRRLFALSYRTTETNLVTNPLSRAQMRVRFTPKQLILQKLDPKVDYGVC